MQSRGLANNLTGTTAHLTEVFPQEHGRHQVRVLPPLLYPLLQVVFWGLRETLAALSRFAILRFLRFRVWLRADDGKDPRVERLSVYPEYEGVQEGDADGVNL